MEVVIQAGQRQSLTHLKIMQAHFTELLSNVRQNLAAPKLSLTVEEEKRSLGGNNLSELMNTLVAGSVDKIKTSLQDLKAIYKIKNLAISKFDYNFQLFLQSDLTFSLKPHFRTCFCSSVREGFVVAFIKFLMDTATGFCVSQTPPTLLLLLSKVCLELEASTVIYLVTNSNFKL